MKKNLLLFIACLPHYLLGQTNATALRVKQQVKQYWSGTWENYERLTFDYLENGLKAERLKEVYTLNTSTGSWNIFSKDIYSYDSLERGTETLIQQYSNGAWVNNIRLETSYDQWGNITNKTTSSWLNNAWQIQIGEQRTYTYSNSAIPDSLTIKTWNTSLLQYDNKRIFTFQHQANNILQANAWLWVNNAWQPEAQYNNYSFFNEFTAGDFWTYFTQSVLTFEKQKFIASTFTNNQKATISMQYPGMPYSELYQSWESNSWADSSKTEYEYYPDNGRDKQTRNYSFIDNAWYQYDGLYTIYSDNTDGNINYQINKAWTNQEWENQDKIIYSYEQFSGIDDKSKPRIMVFPNPAASWVKVEGAAENAKLSVLNIQGQEILKTQLNAQLLQLDNLCNGLYFIQFQNGVMVKLVVEKL